MARTFTFNHVAGVREALRSLPKEASVTLRDASVDIAEDVAAKAEDRARALGGVAKYVPVKARRDRIPKVVMGGTTRLPARDGRPRRGSRQTVGDVMWGAEFGSDRFRQFSPWGGNGETAGYFLWPTIRDESDGIMERYGDALMEAVDKAASRNDG